MEDYVLRKFLSLSLVYLSLVSHLHMTSTLKKRVLIDSMWGKTKSTNIGQFEKNSLPYFHFVSLHL